MTRTIAAVAALLLSVAALPAAAECVKGQPHDVSASTSTEKPVIRAPDANA
ncbi:hypothetical protein SAMN04487972_106120 [Paracoccus halophilus]|nr:hypothetical protein [Paracoccus halophilus]SFA49055.1 hypothetical protein SAMN04487972_106120 [Paracoccus halophilus]